MPDAATARDEVFVGRVAELAAFRQALAGGPAAPVLLHLHGPGGIGKSALLRRFTAEALAAGRHVVSVDGHDVGGRPEAIEAAARDAFGDDRVLLVIDGFEQCRGLECWLRTRFLPRLPEHAVIVIAGRLPLAPEWRCDPGWAPVLRTIALGELPPRDAGALLTARGVPSELHASVLADAGGLPLALSLAAELALREHGWQHTEDVASALLEALAGEVPSAAHRHALRLFAHARTTTPELLRAALPWEDTAALYAWLAALPFVESCQAGLYPHDLVRQALDEGVRGGGEREYRSMHRRILQHLVERARTAGEPLAVEDATQYIYRVGDVKRRYLTFDGHGQLVQDSYRPEDRAELVAMAHQAEGEETARMVAFWLDHQPQNFAVYRSRGTARPVAFMARLGFATVEEAELAADPMVAAAWERCRATGGLAAGEHFSIVRFLVDPAAPRRPSPAMDLMLQDCLAASLRDIGMVVAFSVWSDPDFWQPLLAYADYHPVPGGDRRIDGRRHALFAHDWREVPLPQWLDTLPAAL
ncbi:ATP-binding protein [Amycolatopsis sacchari]|uniref:ATP-binding protein n=1 Tax=Amycolatopsis sacchari TaxID=115433 RepID=UPI003D71D399